MRIQREAGGPDPPPPSCSKLKKRFYCGARLKTYNESTSARGDDIILRTGKLNRSQPSADPEGGRGSGPPPPPPSCSKLKKRFYCGARLKTYNESTSARGDGIILRTGKLNRSQPSADPEGGRGSGPPPPPPPPRKITSYLGF